jgi:hypothetical protein
MDTDLHQIIRSSQPLTNEHFQYFIYQVWGLADKQQAAAGRPAPGEQLSRSAGAVRIACIR